MPQKEKEGSHIRRMADLLRQGSTLTELACPACSSPLFRLKNGDLWCGKCEKKVIVLTRGEEASQVTSSMVLESVEATLLARVQEIQKKMQNTKDMEGLQKLGAALSTLLDNIEKIRKAKKA